MRNEKSIKFHEVRSTEDLANILGFSKAKHPSQALAALLYSGGRASSHYFTFDIPKKNGGFRTINTPDKNLKSVQKTLAECLNKYYPISVEMQKQICISRISELERTTPINTSDLSKYKAKLEKIEACLATSEKPGLPEQMVANGFVRGKSCYTNAIVHKNKQLVINFDIKDFFTQFHYGRVRGYFENNWIFNFPHDVASWIATLCCCNGVLPQGAPTSPIITNMICQIMDMQILKLAKKYRLDYTRYADDLTFSTNWKKFAEAEFREQFIRDLSAIVSKNGFELNAAKTRFQENNRRQSVTGLVVNETINVPKEFYKKTRAMANSLYKTGEYVIDGQTFNCEQLDKLEGRFNYLDSIDHANNIRNASNGTNVFKGGQHLNAREEQFRQFLFYKYFYGNDKPTIIVEGKTDAVYIEAAIKKLGEEYPKLYNAPYNEIKELDYKVYKDASISSVSRETIRNQNSVLHLKKSKGFLKIRFFNRFDNPGRTTRFLSIGNTGGDGCQGLLQEFADKTQKGEKTCYSRLLELSKQYPKNPTIVIFDNEIKRHTTPNKKRNIDLGDKPLAHFVWELVKNNNNKADIIKEIREVTDINGKSFFIPFPDRSLYIVAVPMKEGHFRKIEGDDVEVECEAEIEDLFQQDWLKTNIDNSGRTFSREDGTTKNSAEHFSKTDLANYVKSHYQEIDFSGFKPLLGILNDIITDYEQSKNIVESSKTK